MSKPCPPLPKFVTVKAPRLIGPRGNFYYLDNRPTPALGHAHVVFRHRRTPPRPLFPASPLIDWSPATDAHRSHLWGHAVGEARSAVFQLVRDTANQLSIKIVKDEKVAIEKRVVDHKKAEDFVVSLYGVAVARQPPLNVMHVCEIGFIASQIVAAARHYHEWSLAWADQLAVPRASGVPISVVWQTYDAHTTERLRGLLRAVERGTDSRLELKWHQAPSAVRHFINRAALALPPARHAISAHAAMPGNIISAPMPSRQFLRMVLPEAIKLSVRQRGRCVSDADVFLGVVREMFLMIVGDGNDRLRVGHLEVPNGVGADFVRGIEAIFDVRLLDASSLHAVKRVRKLASAAAKETGPYLKRSIKLVSSAVRGP